MIELNYTPLPLANRAREYTKSDEMDSNYLARRFEQIRSERFLDDYDLTERTAHLDMMWEFAK